MILSNSYTILKWFLGDSQWFANHSEILHKWSLVICKPFLNDSWVIFSDFQWFQWQFSVIHKPFWNDSWVIFSDSQTILKWFLSDSQAIPGDSRTILKWFSSDSRWFVREPFWNHPNFIRPTLPHTSQFLTAPTLPMSQQRQQHQQSRKFMFVFPYTINALQRFVIKTINFISNSSLFGPSQ